MRQYVMIICTLFSFFNAHSQNVKQKKITKTISKKALPKEHSLDYEILNCRIFESEPEYKTCDSGWIKYLSENVDINIAKRNAAPVGKYIVEVSFVTQKDGSVKDLFPITSFGYGMEDELVRVIKHSVDWNPATRNGRKMMFRKLQKFQFVVAEVPVS